MILRAFSQHSEDLLQLEVFKTLYSDRGIQPFAANKKLRLMVKEWGVVKNLEFWLRGLKWSFNESADAPWENGCNEPLMKSVK